MPETMTIDWLTLAVSLIFWLTPIALTIHLAAINNSSNSTKIKVAYLYSSLWAIAILAYLWLFFN